MLVITLCLRYGYTSIQCKCNINSLFRNASIFLEEHRTRKISIFSSYLFQNTCICIQTTQAAHTHIYMHLTFLELQMHFFKVKHVQSFTALITMQLPCLKCTEDIITAACFLTVQQWFLTLQ